jgi:hypothetical protein
MEAASTAERKAAFAMARSSRRRANRSETAGLEGRRDISEKEENDLLERQDTQRNRQTGGFNFFTRNKVAPIKSLHSAD